MNASRRRRITYLLIIVALFTAQVFVGQALHSEARREKLSQESLGEVDPVSGTAQLVCFGFRGVAVTFLWNEVIELNKKERYFEIRPLLNSVTLLQPNFHSPWQYQAWNLAYNIANSWEAVRDKYYWMAEGAKFMREACAKNQNVPDLDWYTGWIYFNRFSIHDDHMYLREIFRREAEEKTDLEFTTNRRQRPDPLECAFDWFTDANDVVVSQMKAPKRMGITPFLSSPAKARTSYAEFMAKEGRFGIDNREAWLDAFNEWLKFGRGYNFERQPNVGEREQFIHRLEYDAAAFEKLDEESRYWVDRFEKIVRYRYWKLRSKVEGLPEMVAAREAFHLAEQLRKEAGDYEGALDKYEVGFAKWRDVFGREEFASLREDQPIQDSAFEWERHYLETLSKLGRKTPAKRPLEDLFGPTHYDMGTANPNIKSSAPAPTQAMPGALDSTVPKK